MKDRDELKSIPPLVPDRDDVASHLSNKRAGSQDIVRSRYATEKVKVSTWPVRIMLTLIVLTLGGAGYGAYYVFGEYQNDLHQADLRISDLERRLALVGDSAEESTLNIIERLDFNFSEIDKLWAARRAINTGMEDVQSQIAKLVIVNTGQDESVATLSQQVAAGSQTTMANETRLNALNAELTGLNQSVAGLNASIQELNQLRGDIQSVQQALNSGDSTVLGLVGRVEYMEESMESVNAHRLQVNESLFRLQENIETLQRSLGATAQ